MILYKKTNKLTKFNQPDCPVQFGFAGDRRRALEVEFYSSEVHVFRLQSSLRAPQSDVDFAHRMRFPIQQMINVYPMTKKQEELKNKIYFYMMMMMRKNLT